ncbi:hypothetical protein [Mucilaginibacter kameinonensis]|nr:hypothetical protein [Mucilaginibacter kameinonensis]
MILWMNDAGSGQYNNLTISRIAIHQAVSLNNIFQVKYLANIEFVVCIYISICIALVNQP